MSENTFIWLFFLQEIQADTLMNSKSEFHQHPVVRVVPIRGLQGEGTSRERGQLGVYLYSN